MRAAIQFWDGQGVDQYELFDEVDSPGSVSALSRGRGELTHIARVLEIVVPDDLPF